LVALIAVQIVWLKWLLNLLKVENRVLSSILSGQSSRTLLRVQNADETVAVDGVDTLWDLKSLAVANCKQREEKCGRKIFPEDPDFLTDI